VAYHGRFNEDHYDAKRPRPAGKVRAEDVLDGTVFQAQEQEKQINVGVKTEDENEEGPAVMRKRKRDDLVEELISTTTTAVKPEIALDDIMAPLRNHHEHVSEPIRPISRTGTSVNELRKASLLHATRTASFAGPGIDLATPSMPATLPQPPSADLLGSKNAIPAIFAGLRFSHLIDEAYESLERALVAHGGRIVSEQERIAGERVDHVIVRL
jgi:DNA replication regulator DPB11